MNFTPLSHIVFTPLARQIEMWGNDSDSRQRNILRVLLKYGQDSEYGRKFHIGRAIHEKGDYVYKTFSETFPVIQYEDIRTYVVRMMNGEKNILWRGRCSSFAQSSGTSGGKSKYIPVTSDSLRMNHYRGAAFSMANYLKLRPDSRIFSGKGLILGGSFANEIPYLRKGTMVGDLSATLIQKMNPVANFFRIPDKHTALLPSWDTKLPKLAAAALNADVTSISGVPSWMLTFLREILMISGSDSLSGIWNNLEVFFHGGISFEPYREEYKKIISSPGMRYFENYNASEGFFAIQRSFDSPRLLLLPDAGIFYEFIPWSSSDTMPLPWWEVEIGKIYELVITAPNGLWRYRTGDTVKIESVSPLTLTIAGRTKTFINAFGEELMENNAENAVSQVCSEFHCSIRNYTAGPLYAHDGRKGRHQWLIEWEKAPGDIQEFADTLDRKLRELNSDYDAKRNGDIFLDSLLISTVPSGKFNEWIKTIGNGRLGGQKKVPRLSNDRKIINAILKLIHEK